MEIMRASRIGLQERDGAGLNARNADGAYLFRRKRFNSIRIVFDNICFASGIMSSRRVFQ